MNCRGRSKSTEIRVNDLLRKMSLRQKIVQLQCLFSVFIRRSNPNFNEIMPDGIGEIAFGYQLDSPEKSAEFIERLQRYLVEETELGIPAIIHTEAISGGIISEMTQFPSPIGLGATWDPDGVQKMAELIRRQVIAVGIRRVLSPVVDVARDPRWGRMGETFGEDPVLCSQMAVAYVRGMQGERLSEGVLSCAKHFIGYSMGEGGLNQSRNPITPRELREVYAKPFQAVITEAGIGSIMAQYGAIDGEMVIGSKPLLDNLLRKEMKFRGTVVSDYMAINRMVAMKVAENIGKAGIMAIKAGLDQEFPVPAGFKTQLLIDAVEKGELDEEIINRSVKRVLRQKFQLGLFENPYPRRNDIKKYYYNTDNDRMSFELAQKSLVLLKNDGILPLKKNIKSIAVIGPHSDSLRLMFGGYTYPAVLDMILEVNVIAEGMEEYVSYSKIEKKAPDTYPGSNITVENPMVESMLRSMFEKSQTILQAIRNTCKNAKIYHARGCDYAGSDRSGFKQAVEAVKAADVAILAIGGKLGWAQSSTMGENLDSMNIGLPGVQEDLAREVLAAGKPTVVLHLSGRPLNSEFITENCNALLECWSPSVWGGQAIASALFGDFNPSGKLPVTVARNAGQIPIYYNHVNGVSYHNKSIFKQENMYVDGPEKPLFYFGQGLSYTRFEYSNLRLDKEVRSDGKLTVSVDVRNAGRKDGAEVVQLYIADELSSMLRPNKELAGFKRVELKAGETKTVVFTVRVSQFAFLDISMKWKVEAGDMTVMIGSSSEDIRLRDTFRIIGSAYVDASKRGFYADTRINTLS
jgi:beta-glucosidase